ncbi:hexitol phosphatase HxpB [Taibaiella chishuiensis]|uniref:Sugar-phosphatase n=1 Tax=Taibaiella chishuiensis TaxID=1434707 RepID=A0A2P8D417_9BACT|nr:hexitol phosphatase HxpB [Taibaiella chishuiensis]PSK91960.1 sugar-phosphatase [Taibaiella chishuiensis]
MAAIFDMDGLLLDTEPLWGVSMLKIAEQYQVPVGPDFFKYTTGLRIYEVTEFWKERFPWPGAASARQLADDILDDIIALSKAEGGVMPGALQSLQWLRSAGIKIGLATSSPTRMLDALIDHFDLRSYFDVLTSADTALFGKPHPEVYMQCAHALNEATWNCVALEDSVNGMISAKAARMKVIVVPEEARFDDPRFGLADAKLHSLETFGAQVWREVQLK